jgi:DNA-binding YbaB/EbfC family protein
MNPRQLEQMARQMQKEMMRIQEELANTTVEGTAGSYVTVTMNGHREIKSIKLAPEVVDPMMSKRCRT